MVPVKYKGSPARGVAVAHAEPLQSTPPRAQGHRRACTQHSSARPPSLKARSGQTLRQKATILPTAFLQSHPRVGGGAWPKPLSGRPSRTPSARLHSPLYTPVERGHAAATAADPAVCFPPTSDSLPLTHPHTRHCPASRERPRSPAASQCACARRGAARRSAVP